MSTLYMVATPIGNLEDITYRAVKILQSVDVVACEDTRHSQNMLNHLGISKRLIACHAHNEEASAAGIVKLLDQGQTVAYVSDAGTPGVSDPGARVVGAVRSSGHEVVPIPGPSALAALVSVASFTGKSFTFEGFLSPRKGRRRKRLAELLGRDEAFVVYESPYRIVEVLADIASLAPNRRVLVGREMTKAFEEFIEGSAARIAAEFARRESVKGEFAVCVSPAAADSPDSTGGSGYTDGTDGIDGTDDADGSGCGGCCRDTGDGQPGIA